MPDEETIRGGDSDAGANLPNPRRDAETMVAQLLLPFSHILRWNRASGARDGNRAP